MDQGRFSVFPHENFVDLFLVQFGWEQCESLYSYGPHVSFPERDIWRCARKMVR